VFRRDSGECAARRIDPHAGPCYDHWGKQITKVPWEVGEMDYVRLEAHGPRHTLVIDHVWLCPGHHRGTGPSAGYVWATSHRRDERNYLENGFTKEAR
jgi:hypothetical protein